MNRTQKKPCTSFACCELNNKDCYAADVGMPDRCCWYSSLSQEQWDIKWGGARNPIDTDNTTAQHSPTSESNQSRNETMNEMHNLSVVYALLLPNAITVKVRFQDQTTSKLYTYKALTDWNIQVGQQVVVFSKMKGCLVIADVIEVDDVLDISPGVVYKWIVQVVDMAAHDDLVEKEKKVGAHVQLKQREEARRQLLRQLLGSYEDEKALRLELGLPTEDLDPMRDVEQARRPETVSAAQRDAVKKGAPSHDEHGRLILRTAAEGEEALRRGDFDPR